MKKQTPAKAGLTIGRAVLDNDLNRNKNNGLNRIPNVAEAYLKNPRAYRKRLKVLIMKAVAEGVDLLLLPASALVWQNASHLRSYRNAAQKIPWVVGGQLQIPIRRGKEYPVKTVAWCQGKRLNYIEPGTIHWLLCGRSFAVVVTSNKAKWLTESSVAVLEMKSHDFAPCRLKSLMDSVQCQKRHPQKIAAIQSHWKPRDAGLNAHQPVPKQNSKYDFQRWVLYHKSDGAEDFLDIFRFKKLKVDLSWKTKEES